MRCNHVKVSAPAQCTRGLYTLQYSDYQSDDENQLQKVKTFEVYCNNLPHNHDNLPNKSARVRNYVKQKIISYVKDGKVATQITKLRADNTIKPNDQPKMQKIRNVIQNYSAQQQEMIR